MNVLVTGGARGIGAGIVRKLAEQKANVAFCGRGGIECAEAFLIELRQNFPGKFEYYQYDISSAAGRNKLLKDFCCDFGSIDMLVNNAGVAPEVRADITEMSEESFDRVMNINLKGPFFLTQAVANRMIADGKKDTFRCIVNVGSVSADIASISRGEYCLSKAGVSMATKLWAVRLAELDIPVYEIRPGIIATDIEGKEGYIVLEKEYYEALNNLALAAKYDNNYKSLELRPNIKTFYYLIIIQRSPLT